MLICASSIVFLKQNSSLGRLLIYKISINIYKEHWLYGIGFNKFKTTYMYYQANYFLGKNYTKQELLLADNTYYAFNDYFQFIIENGVFGLLLLILVFISVFYLFKNVIKKSSESIIVKICCCTLITISIAALFNYFLYRYEVQIIVLS